MSLSNDCSVYYRTCVNCPSNDNSCVHIQNPFFEKHVNKHSAHNNDVLVFPTDSNSSFANSNALSNGLNNCALFNAENPRQNDMNCSWNNCCAKRKLFSSFECDINQLNRNQREEVSPHKRCRNDVSNDLFTKSNLSDYECVCKSSKAQTDFNMFNHSAIKTPRLRRSSVSSMTNIFYPSLCTLNASGSYFDDLCDSADHEKSLLDKDRLNVNDIQRIGMVNIKENLTRQKKMQNKLCTKSQCHCATRNTVRRKHYEKCKKRASSKLTQPPYYKKRNCSHVKDRNLQNNKAKKTKRFDCSLKIKTTALKRSMESDHSTLSNITKNSELDNSVDGDLLNISDELRQNRSESNSVNKQQFAENRELKKISSQELLEVKNKKKGVKRKKNKFTNVNMVDCSELIKSQELKNKTNQKTKLLSIPNSDSISKERINGDIQCTSLISNEDTDVNVKMKTPIPSVSDVNINKSCIKISTEVEHITENNVNISELHESQVTIAKENELTTFSRVDEEELKTIVESKNLELPLPSRTSSKDKVDNLNSQTNFENVEIVEKLNELTNEHTDQFQKSSQLFNDRRKFSNDDQDRNYCKNIIFVVVENPDCKMGCCYRVYRQCTFHGVTVPANRYTTLHDVECKPMPVYPVPENLKVSTCLLQEHNNPELTTAELSEVIFIAKDKMKQNKLIPPVSKDSRSTCTVDE